jgi:hypothetical protein
MQGGGISGVQSAAEITSPQSAVHFPAYQPVPLCGPVHVPCRACTASFLRLQARLSHRNVCFGTDAVSSKLQRRALPRPARCAEQCLELCGDTCVMPCLLLECQGPGPVVATEVVSSDHAGPSWVAQEAARKVRFQLRQAYPDVPISGLVWGQC